MHRALAWIVMALCTVGTAGAVGCAHAAPGPPPAQPPPSPAAGVECPGELEGALTVRGDVEPTADRKLLECSDGTWVGFDDPYPSSDLWVSSGPEFTVLGQAVRHPEFRSGVWTATPLAEDTVCGVITVEAQHAGVGGDTQTRTGERGESLSFEASPRLANVTLSGYCLWQRDG